MGTFFIESLAEPNELVLTQFTVRPDEPKMRSKDVAEQAIKQRHPGFNIRFHYGTMELGQRAVSSAEFGAHTVTANVRKQAFGGVAFGTPKNKVSTVKELDRKATYAYCNNHQGAVLITYLNHDTGGYLFNIVKEDAHRMGFKLLELRLDETEVLQKVFHRS